MAGLYLEPIGLLHGAAAREAVESGAALPLAGGPIAFGGVRIWEGEPGRMTRAAARISTLIAIEDLSIKELLGRIIAPRSSLAGLALHTTRIMGIVNVTPDSFSDGGEAVTPEAAVALASKLVAEGADLIDIGGESTRPGSDGVPAPVELERILPVLRKLAGTGVPLSVDTRKPEVMRAAAEAGAAILNDVSGLTFAPDSVETAAALKKPVIVMHAQGEPKTMQDNPTYVDVAVEVYDFLESRIEAATTAGLPHNLIVADPGIGFGKRLSHNIALFQSLGIFHALGVPLLIGVSRKGMIRDIAGPSLPKGRASGSLAAALAAVSKGVQIIRTHDVLGTRQALLVWQALHLDPTSDDAKAVEVEVENAAASIEA